MDSRHESLQQETLNHLIDLINQYTRENTDKILKNNELQDDIKRITKSIYHCAGMEIDVENILSKKNFLSIDTVPLPNIDEMLPNESDFVKLVNDVKSISTKKNGDDGFSKNLREILAKTLIF